MLTTLAHKEDKIKPSEIQKHNNASKGTGSVNITPGEWTIDRDWHWTRTVMLCGLFVGMGAIAFFGRQTLVSNTLIWRIVVLCMLAGFVIPYRIYNRWLGINKLEMLMFCVFGIGLCSSALIFALNFLIPLDTQTVSYSIVNRDITLYSYPEELLVCCELEDSALCDFPVFRRFSTEEPEGQEAMNAVAIEYTISKGLFRMKVIRHQRFIE